MPVSARNQLAGTVSAVAKGAVNDELEITLQGGENWWPSSRYKANSRWG